MRSSLRIFDLFPQPVRSLLDGLGLGETYWSTFWHLTRKMRSPSAIGDSYQRPFAFLAGSTVLALLATLGIAGLASTLDDDLNWTSLLAGVVPLWLLLYVFFLFIDLGYFLLVMIVMRIFRKTFAPLPHWSKSVSAMSYAMGWQTVAVALCYIPVDVAMSLGSSPPSSPSGIYVVPGAILSMISFSMGARSGLVRSDRAMTLLWYSSMTAVAPLVGLGVLAILAYLVSLVFASP